MKEATPSFVYALFFLILSTILLTLPGSAFPRDNWLNKIWFDKWVHIGMFALLVVLWCWTAYNFFQKRRKLKFFFIAIAVIFVAYGIAMEFVQQRFVSNRSFDRGDIIADIVGCLAGLIFSTGRYIKK